MNRVILCGRVCADPKPNDAHTVVKYTLAVDRVGKDKETDFINCVAFGKTGEFATNYLHKGTKILIEGRIQTGSYTNQEGKKVTTTDIVVDRHEFVESRNNAAANLSSQMDDFMNIPDIPGEELPFD